MNYLLDTHSFIFINNWRPSISALTHTVQKLPMPPQPAWYLSIIMLRYEQEYVLNPVVERMNRQCRRSHFDFVRISVRQLAEQRLHAAQFSVKLFKLFIHAVDKLTPLAQAYLVPESCD